MTLRTDPFNEADYIIEKLAGTTAAWGLHTWGSDRLYWRRIYSGASKTAPHLFKDLPRTTMQVREETFEEWKARMQDK